MRITARGLGLLGAAVVALAAGFGFAYPELTVLGVAAGLAVGYAVATAVFRPRLVVTRRVDPDRVARGEAARLTLTVRNGGRWGSTLLVAEERCGDSTVAVPLLRLRPGRETTVGYDVPTDRRGVVPVGPLWVRRGDPLGLVSSTRGYGEVVSVWVHPRVHPLTVVPTGSGRSLDGRVDGVPHGSITFDSLREYVVGDELRRVHWRTSARVGELMVRENVDTSLPRIVVLLDNRVGAHPERVDATAASFESACEAAASVVAAAFREGLPVVLSMVVPDDDPDAPPLDRLTTVGLAEGALSAATARLRQRRAGDTLVVLTGPGGRDGLGEVGALRGAYPSVVVAVFGAPQPTPAGTAGLLVVDAADGAAFAAEWDRVPRW